MSIVFLTAFPTDLSRNLDDPAVGKYFLQRLDCQRGGTAISALPFTNDPGAVFTYNSGAVYMLSQALEQQIGMTIPEYAEQQLFSPLGIEKVKWEGCHWSE